jgi:hypothetical protein
VASLLAAHLAPAESQGLSGMGDEKASRFFVVLRTSDVDKAGTDADIDFGLTWTGADGEKRGDFYVLPDAPGNNHEKGSVDVHALKVDAAIPIRSINGAQIVNEMGGDKPGWHVHSIALFAVDGNGELWLLADSPVNKWLERARPSLCSMAVSMKEPKNTGPRTGSKELGKLVVMQDLSEKKRADVGRAIAEAEFKNPGGGKAWMPDPD